MIGGGNVHNTWI
uniref:RNA polymerase beta subunit n=1 Tax=Aganosma cymosa TaxID=429249 RepID=A0A0A0RS12_9GENT|nr:RNA polymerase beta subunit [Aganosma cymosa]